MDQTRAGWVNAHTHLYSGLAPLGMPAPSPPPENFVQILERLWWRLDRALDAELLRASARYYVAHALLAGTTTLIDHHESPRFIAGSLDVLASACAELGVRAALTYGATERNGGRAEGQAGLDECRRFIEANSDPRLVGLVGLHASFTVSDPTVEESLALCDTLKVPLHIHLAEDAADVRDAQERGYHGPLERLLALGALPADTILAHGIHIDTTQVTTAALHGAFFVQNPRSNTGNGVGYPSALRVTERVGLGTDGYPADMGEEEDALRNEARSHGDDEVAASRRLETGRELGRTLFGPAIDDDRVTLRDGRVWRVEVAGKAVVDEGTLCYGDLDAITRDASRAADILWRRMAAL